MGLASGANSVQKALVGTSSSRTRAVQILGSGLVLATEIGYAIASKFDPSVPSPTSRIDRLVMDARQSTGDGAKVAIVTGANSGIGLETAKALGRAGFHTILACRNLESGSEAAAKLARQTGLEDRFEVMELDLASLASVRAFTEKFKAGDRALDLLVCNAGVMACPLAKTADNIEMQFGTNHIGHFALTQGLVGQLQRAEAPRVVVVSSMGAFMTPAIVYDKIEDDAQYDRSDNYAISKLANMTFGATLARKHPEIKVVVVHPGSIASGLTRHVNGGLRVVRKIEGAVLLDAVAGAVTSVYAALSPDIEGSGVFYNRGLQMDMHPMAKDEAEQDKLWEYSEKLVSESAKK
ncbi:hypothetical protein LPJ53_002007 [Coemansia erecta]|uniref:NAD(P)-binding protein n=1 Tax=Coemansia erecta TaxID=147472 RepID=A0A9W7Y567_9FUNG|nr:hypothetical protein LPJ53_002007 [Coemansia erecta]